MLTTPAASPAGVATSRTARVLVGGAAQTYNRLRMQLGLDEVAVDV